MCVLLTRSGNNERKGLPATCLEGSISQVGCSFEDVSFKVFDTAVPKEEGRGAKDKIHPSNYFFFGLHLAKTRRVCSNEEITQLMLWARQYYYGFTLKDGSVESWIGKTIQFKKCSNSLHGLCIVEAPEGMILTTEYPAGLVASIDAMLPNN